MAGYLAMLLTVGMAAQPPYYPQYFHPTATASRDVGRLYEIGNTVYSKLEEFRRTSWRVYDGIVR